MCFLPSKIWPGLPAPDRLTISASELERLARDKKLPRPLYFLLGENGPGHARTFTVEVRVGKEFSASAEGPSKKVASHNAARKVCDLIKPL